MLSKSSASSRAIPVEKLIERVMEDPWIPDYIGANQKGMQPGEELDGVARMQAVDTWIEARNAAVKHARNLIGLKVHKGVVNRLLEPWMFITVIISGTEWENFFGLRCHEAAEPHFQHIARMMRDARAASEPKKLAAGEWHLPLVFDEDHYHALTFLAGREEKATGQINIEEVERLLVKVSVGRCARVSYLNHEGKRDLQADIDLHDRLMVQRPLHAAPAEHVTQAMDWPSWFKERHEHFTKEHTPAELRSHFQERDAMMFGTCDEKVKDFLWAAPLALRRMQSGNFLGFKQWRKHLVDENIGGLMP